MAKEDGILTQFNSLFNLLRKLFEEKNYYSLRKTFSDPQNDMKELLLHSCCAPCSGAIIEWLLANGYRPTVFFFNPNITPKDEYEKRKTELVRFCEKHALTVIDGDYDHEKWLAAVRGLEHEPERGKRCEVCFNLRLRAAARVCKELGLETFTTSLASSRWKDLEQVNRAGKLAAQEHGVAFWDKNWRKGGLQERRNAIIREEAFYNQTWCGYEFSRQAMESKAKEKILSENGSC